MTSPALPVASGLAIMTAQNGKPRRGCCCLTFIGHYYVFMILYLYTENYNHVFITRIPEHFPCGPAPADQRLVRYRSEAVSIGPVKDRFWCVGAHSVFAATSSVRGFIVYIALVCNVMCTIKTAARQAPQQRQNISSHCKYPLVQKGTVPSRKIS